MVYEKLTALKNLLTYLMNLISVWAYFSDLMFLFSAEGDFGINCENIFLILDGFAMSIKELLEDSFLARVFVLFLNLSTTTWLVV